VTRTVRRLTDIPIVAGDLRRAGELLGRPCGCDHHDTLGEHILRATKDMTAGPTAQNLDPTRGPTASDTELDDQADPGLGLHGQVLERINEAWAAALLLIDQVQSLRPDRGAQLELVTTDDEWCRSCMRIGKCSPRYRGDLCHRPCYEFHQLVRQDPPIWLVAAHHEGRKLTEKMLSDAIREVRPKRRRKRRAG
jgi:hypothetical protein